MARDPRARRTRSTGDAAMPLGHDLAAIAGAITGRTRLVYLANPNNPTGTWFDAAEFDAFMAGVPGNVIVVVDEAYAEYVDAPGWRSAVDALPAFSNLIVTRTFSKAHALAGLRVGYALGDAGAIAVYHGEPNLASSLFFYLGRRVHWVGARPNADFAPRTLGVGRELYLSDEQFVSRWKGPGQVFLMTEESCLGDWESKLGLSAIQRQPVGRSGTRVLLCNDPRVGRRPDAGAQE